MAASWNPLRELLVIWQSVRIFLNWSCLRSASRLSFFSSSKMRSLFNVEIRKFKSPHRNIPSYFGEDDEDFVEKDDEDDECGLFFGPLFPIITTFFSSSARWLSRSTSSPAERWAFINKKREPNKPNATPIKPFVLNRRPERSVWDVSEHSMLQEYKLLLSSNVIMEIKNQFPSWVRSVCISYASPHLWCTKANPFVWKYSYAKFQS